MFKLTFTHIKNKNKMDIFAEEGTKVIYSGKNGYASELKQANEYLTINEKYTVSYTVVHGWNTEVYLKEFPNIGFNSVHFEDIDDIDDIG